MYAPRKIPVRIWYCILCTVIKRMTHHITKRNVVVSLQFIYGTVVFQPHGEIRMHHVRLCIR